MYIVCIAGYSRVMVYDKLHKVVTFVVFRRGVPYVEAECLTLLSDKKIKCITYYRDLIS